MNFKNIVSWVLIISMIFSTNSFYVLADSFDMESVSLDHIDEDESGKYYYDEGTELSEPEDDAAHIVHDDGDDDDVTNMVRDDEGADTIRPIEGDNAAHEVRGDEDLEVSDDEAYIVCGDEETEAESDESIEVDAANTVRGDEAHEVRGDEAHTVRGDEDQEVSDDEANIVHGDEEIEAENDEFIEVDVAHTVRGDEAHEVRGDDIGAKLSEPEDEKIDIASNSEISDFHFDDQVEEEATNIVATESEIQFEIATDSEVELVIPNDKLFGDGTHSHKICGVTGDCTHTKDVVAGTNNHLSINSWEVLNETSDLQSKGPYFYLTGDKTLSINYPDVPSAPRNIYICLNGHNITLNSGIKAYGKVHITNCGETASLKFEGSSYDPIKANIELYGVDNNIICEYQQRVLFFNDGVVDKIAYLYSVDLKRVTSLSDNPDISSVNQNSKIALEKVKLSNPIGGGCFIHAGSTPGTYYFIDTNLDFGNTERYLSSGGALFDIYSNSSLTNNVINFKGNNVIKNIKLKNINLLNKMNQNEFAINILDGTTTFSDITMLNPEGGYGPRNFINKSLGYTVPEGSNLEFKNIFMTNEGDPLDTNLRYLISINNNDSFEGGLVIDGCKSNDPFAKMINLETNQKLKIGGDKVFIENNINTFDDTNAAGIYVNGTRPDTPIISVNSGKTINSETYISGIVFPENANYSGHIVDSFASVSGGRTCDEVFTAYNYKGNYRGLSVALKSGNAVIGFNHEHKICGVTGACTHTTDVVPGTDAHTLIDSWQPLYQQSDLTNVGVGPYFFLIEDKTLTLGDSLTRDVYICLNGHKLTYGANLSNTSYKVHITNCGADAFIEDNDTEIKTNVQIYGVNTNITYNYGHYIVHTENPSQNIYLYDVSFKRTGNANDEDFRLGNNSDNSVLTLEKVQMINCAKTGNNHTRLFTACPYDTVLNIIDSTFDFNGTQRKGPQADNNTESLFLAVSDAENFRRNSINFRGNNVIKNLVLLRLSIISTQNNGKNNFNINFVNGTTTFQNIAFDGSSAYNKHFINNTGLTLGGHITVAEDATLEIKNIDMRNYSTAYNFTQRHIMQLTAEDSIFGNLIISDCVTNSDFGRILYLHSNDINPARPRIGNGKIQIVNNRTTSGNIASGIFSDDWIFTIGNTEFFVVADGKTINPETRIEGMLVHYDNQPRQPIMIVRDWDTVSGGSQCQDLYTANSYYYGENVGVRLVDGHAKIVDAASYTVSFRDKDGNPLPGVNDQTVTEGVKLKICTPSIAPKQEFVGWYKDLGDESTKWNFDDDRVNESFTLYAKIINHYTYTLSYNSNGGTGLMDDRIGLMTNTAITLDANTYEKFGHKFIGWASTSDATAPDWIDGDTTFTHEVLIDEETYTIYAVWQKILYTLSFDGNGHDGGVVPANRESIRSGETIQLATERPTRTNYKFIGWATSSTATVGVYQPGGNFTYIINPEDFDPTAPEQIKTIYAVWKQITYTVTYNKNGGEGADMPVSNGISGNYLSLSANAYTKTGFRFRGWDENPSPADPFNPQYPIGSMTMNKVLTEAQDETNINVYAIWTQIYYKVKYHENPGTGTVTGATPSEMRGYSDVALTLANNTGGIEGSLAREGKYLVGWDENSSVTNPTYTLGDTMTKTISESDDGSTVDLYAIWGNVPYTIKLNNNGGVGDAEELPAQSEVDVNLPANTFTRVKYKFIGWSENANIDPTTFNPTAAGNYPPTGGIVNRVVDVSQMGTIYNLFAVWQKYVYTLHYDLQGGAGTIADITDAGSEDNITLSSVIPAKANATFLGWSDTPGQTTNPQYLAGGTYTATVDTDGVIKNIYAVWNPMYEYIISFNANGGEGYMGDITATSSIARTLPSNGFARSEYTFIGWSENSAATSATYTNSITKSVDTSGVTVVLYAVWVYNGGGGGGGGGHGGSGGGGGSSGGSGVVNPSFMAPKTTRINQVKYIKDILIAETGVWNYDPTRDEWKYSAKNVYGETINANNGFYLISHISSLTINDSIDKIVNETYYFDVNGNMQTGFIITIDGKTYFMENLKNVREGRMVFGWKQIGSDWYYFKSEGEMLVNNFTPDGYKIGNDGKWQQS